MGRQSVVVVMDVKKSVLLRRYEVFTHNGARETDLDPVTFARRVEALGAGEVVVNSIDWDGEMKGYDLDLLARVRESISLPLTALGNRGWFRYEAVQSLFEDLVRGHDDVHYLLLSVFMIEEWARMFTDGENIPA